MMNVLVLNMDYSPMNVTTLQRGFNLVFKGKAEVVEHIDNKPIVTETKNFKRPTVIRLLRYIVVPFKKVQLTRQNIFRRDGHKCMYCGDNKNLTIDHVQPKSKGGPNSWKNFATSCFACNLKKADRTPEEAGMVLSHKPFVPTYLYFVEQMQNIHTQWKQYVGIVE